MTLLVVVRHAEAADPPGTRDLDRPLRPEGRRDAVAAGRWLRDAVGRPALVVASPARRVAETVEGLLGAFAEPPPVVREPALYGAAVEDVLGLVRALDADATPVVLVGHNPVSSELVTTLTGQDVTLLTAGTAVVELTDGWADAEPGCGRLLQQTAPRAPES